MDKVALITGANKGIGFETARQLGSLGIKVLVGARSKEKAAAAVDKLKADNVDAYPVQLDVTKDEDVKSALAYVADNFGKLDILVNNAGIIQGESFAGNSTLDVTQDDLKDTFNTNFFGVVNLTQQALPLIEKSNAGRIVNLSSILGSVQLHGEEGSPIYGSKPFAYNASKTALNQFTVHLAATLKGTKIKVNSVHPGWVQTDMGGEVAPMAIEDGAKTSVELATIGEDGPTGKYIHMGKELPW